MVDQIIPPSALPRRTNPVASEIVPVDNGTSVAGSTLAEIVNAGRPVASRAEAEAGADSEKAMTPLTVDQKIEYEIGRSLASKAQGDKADSAIQEIIEGTNTTVDNTDPQRPIISSSGNPSAGFKSDIVVVDGQTDWRVARNYKTVSDLLADDGSGDMGMGYSGSGANVVVSPGDIVTAQGFRYEVAASGATDAHVETAGGVKLYVLRVTNRLFAEAFGLVANDESKAAANKTLWATIRRATRSARGSKILELGAGTYYFSPDVHLAGDDGAERDDGLTIQSSAGAILKPAATTEDKSWFFIRGGDNVRLSGVEFDGNRANTPNMHPDRCILVIFDTQGTRVEDCKFHSSYGKGVSVAAGGTGKGAIDVHVIGCEGWNCRSQVFMTDRTNLINNDTRPCIGTIFERLVVRDTDHAGIAVNDGSLNTKVLNCNVDNNNSTWEAISVRGSRNTLIQGCTGRRGKFGFRALTLDAAAIARGEICDGLILVGNQWENNRESGCAIIGTANFSVTGDTAKNNGQAGGTFFGFIAIQQSGVKRAANGSFNGVLAFDDQAVPTQHTAIAVLSADKIKVVNPIMYGNTTRNRVYYNSDVTGLEVLGDGPNGATRKMVSQGTPSVAAGASETVTLNFATSFDVAPNWAQASVFVGTSGAALRVDHIAALSASSLQVRLTNTAASAVSGTVHAEAAYLS